LFALQMTARLIVVGVLVCGLDIVTSEWASGSVTETSWVNAVNRKR
jgi:hypothetical protein